MKKVFVSGAEGSLGHVVCSRFLQSGAEVFGGYRDQPGELPGVTWVRHDGSKPACGPAKEALAQAEALVHCAGGFRFAFADQVTEEEVDFLIQSNLKSSLMILREVLPGMKTRGRGRIVFVSSSATVHPVAGMSAYAACKAGINAIVQSAQLEVKDLDIGINAVLPTMIDTPANRRDMPKGDPSKWVSREALAEIIFSLTDSWGAPVRGALIPVAGRL